MRVEEEDGKREDVNNYAGKMITISRQDGYNIIGTHLVST